MIRAIVTTLQENVECHVTTFVVLPRVGERIWVRYKGVGNYFSKVKSVTHCIGFKNEPFVEIEVWSDAIDELNRET